MEERPIAFFGIGDKIFIEAVPGMYTFVATRAGWNGLSESGRYTLIEAILRRLGLPTKLAHDVVSSRPE